ncbi:hypothetical protein SPHINGOT1_510035 [Sphingomonas sp. T1]|nr:hypothetical protein SPHINGOT1_510035 [Sphingomonas sp. T1]
MTRFAATAAPLDTKWGAPVTTNQVLPGVWHVTTADHGGYVPLGRAPGGSPRGAPPRRPFLRRGCRLGARPPRIRGRVPPPADCRH